MFKSRKDESLSFKSVGQKSNSKLLLKLKDISYICIVWDSLNFWFLKVKSIKYIFQFQWKILLCMCFHTQWVSQSLKPLAKKYKGPEMISLNECSGEGFIT